MCALRCFHPKQSLYQFARRRRTGRLDSQEAHVPSTAPLYRGGVRRRGDGSRRGFPFRVEPSWDGDRIDAQADRSLSPTDDARGRCGSMSTRKAPPHRFPGSSPGGRRHACTHAQPRGQRAEGRGFHVKHRLPGNATRVPRQSTGIRLPAARRSTRSRTALRPRRWREKFTFAAGRYSPWTARGATIPNRRAPPHNSPWAKRRTR